jgi:hypothetical protein
MTDFAHTHVRTSRAGSYYYAEKLPRGHVEIIHDQRRYVYNMIGYGRPARALKMWIASVFDRPVKGRYPRYNLD